MLARPIFKGRTSSGQWVTGSLLAEGDPWFIQDDTMLHPIERYSLETFTGRTDKKNNMVFTGDTVRWHGTLWKARWNGYLMMFQLTANGETIPLSCTDNLALELVETEGESV